MTAEPPERDLADLAMARARSGPASPRRRSAGGPPRGAASSRDPQLIGQAVDRLVSEQDWTEELVAAGLLARWAEIVGPDLADHVVPESFDATTRHLILRAESTAWATQVRLLLPIVRERISAAVGPIGVIDITGPATPSWVRGPRRVPGRGPRDTYG